MKKEINFMDEFNTILLIIDIQEKLIDGILNKNQILLNIDKLVKSSKILNLESLYSEQNPKRLGATIDNIKTKENCSIYSKMSFSCCNCTELMRQIKSSNKIKILVCGIETHICVQQTCIDLLSKGYDTYIAIDAIGSRKEIDHEIAIRRLDSIGVKLTTTEGAIFEWCRYANRPEFREISAIIKKKKLEFNI